MARRDARRDLWIVRIFDAEFGFSDIRSNDARVYSWMANQLGHLTLGLAGTVAVAWIVDTTGTPEAVLGGAAAGLRGAFWAGLGVTILLGVVGAVHGPRIMTCLGTETNTDQRRLSWRMWRFLSALVAVFVAAPIVLGQISEHANAALVGAILLLILAGAAWLAWVALRPVADRRAATAPTGVCGLSHPRRQALALALVLGAVALASALAFRHRRRPGATLHRVSPAWPSLLSSSASSFSDWRRTGALLSSVSAPCSLARSPPRAPSAAICPGSTSASSARSRRTRTAPSFS